MIFSRANNLAKVDLCTMSCRVKLVCVRIPCYKNSIVEGSWITILISFSYRIKNWSITHIFPSVTFEVPKIDVLLAI